MCGCVFGGRGRGVEGLEVWVFVMEGLCVCLCVLGAVSGVCIRGVQ